MSDKEFTVEIDLSVDEKVSVETDLEMTESTELDLDLTLTGGSSEHQKLTGRNLPDQHPIEAISGLEEALHGKVDIEAGKLLTSNDFTNEYREKLDSIEKNAEVNIIEHIWVNGEPQEVLTDRVVDLYMPTTTKELNDTGNVVYRDNDQVIYGEKTFEANVNIGTSEDLKFLDLKGSEAISQNLKVDGDVSIGGSVEILGETSIDNNVIIEGDLSSNKTLTVEGTTNLKSDVTLDKKLSVTGEAELKSALEVIGQTTLKDNVTAEKDLSVTGETKLKDNVTAEKDLSVEGSLTVTGDLELNGGVIIDKDLTVRGTTTLESEAELKKSLTVDGVVALKDNVTLDKNLRVVGSSTLESQVDIKGVANITNNVNVVGDLNISGNISQKGENYETHAEQVYSTSDYITLRDGAVSSLLPDEYSGFEINLYDGTNTGRLVIDNTGTARVGDIGDEQPLLTREESSSLVDGGLLVWDAENSRAKTTQEYSKTSEFDDVAFSGDYADLVNTPTKLSDFTDDTDTNPIKKAQTLKDLTVTSSTLNLLSGATSNIQEQLNQLDKDLDTAQETLSKEIGDTKTEIENTIQPKLDELASTKQDVLTSANAGDGISIVNGVISNTRVSAEWGNIQGDITTQTDLQNELGNKVDLDDMVEVDIDGIKSDIQNLENTKANKSNITSKGNSTTPVYFDANGVAQPITSYSGNANTATQATKAIQDGNGRQINTTYAYKTIGSQGIPDTPTGVTRLEMVGKQARGNGVIGGSNLLSLHSNTAYKCYERKSATITCNYEDKVGNLGKNLCDGSFGGYYTAINPSTMFTGKPFVWEVVSPTQFEVSDVLRLHLHSHRLADQVNCTAFKIEAYIQDTLDNTKKWVTVYNYSGASVNIAQTGWGLYITGHSTNPYYSIFGVRLTISSSPDTVFRLSEIQLVASRGTERVCDAIQCLSTDGGKIWGNLEVTGNLTNKTQPENTNNTTVATTAFVKNNTVTKTLDGTSKKTWIGTSAKYDTDKASGLITNTTECLITDDEEELTLGVDTYTKDEIDDKIKNSYYVGQIIPSLDPLNYASLRLLDGSLLQVGGIYDEFISKYIDPLFKKYPNRFISESEWQQQVSTYGVCGKYVYTEGVAVRLPKVTGIVEGTIDPSALGDLVEAGLPAHTHTRGTMNITGTFFIGKAGQTGNGYGASGAFYYKGNANTGNTATTGGVTPEFAFDASRSWTGSTSNPNYTNDIKTADTVQPQTIKGYYYIVVATGIDKEVNLEFDNITTDLNQKVDISNMVDASSYISAQGKPSSKRIDLTWGASGSTYIAPANGWFVIGKRGNATNQYMYVEVYDANNKFKINNCLGSTGTSEVNFNVPVAKGDKFTATWDLGGQNMRFYFTYDIGSESEA